MTGMADTDTPCMHCDRTPSSGAWNEPCPKSTDRLHWTPEMRSEHEWQRLLASVRSLSRAAAELDQVAAAIEALPPRIRRKLKDPALNPDIIRNEAERARDTLHVYSLRDV